MGTKTSKFGVSKREGHDSSEFYSKKLYGEQKEDEDMMYIQNPIPEEVLDKIIQADSRNMSFIPDSSVHLMVTSPPYNVGKEYDEDLSLNEYIDLLKDVFKETYRVLVPGGRACINIANLGRKPYIPLHTYIIKEMIDIGYLMRGEVIWNKNSTGNSCAWGSWMSAANPTLRDVHEYIMIFSKGKFSRPAKGRKNTITDKEFLEYTQSIWTFSSESAKKVGHPAPFPLELPSRLIKLYTFKKDVVLDPFCGSGTTCLAAKELNRHYIGIDIAEEYVELSKERLDVYQQKLSDY